MMLSAPTTNWRICRPRSARDLTDDAHEIDKIAQQLQWLATFIKRWEEAAREPGAAASFPSGVRPLN
jgi:hypothetical protein